MFAYKRLALFRTFVLCAAAALVPSLRAGSRVPVPLRKPHPQGKALSPTASAAPPHGVYPIKPQEEGMLVVRKWLKPGGPCAVGEWGLSVARQSRLARVLHLNLVVVSGPRKDAPDGFLRRIVSIRHLGGQTVFCTEQARLGDAIPEGTLERSIQFGFTDIASVHTMVPDVFVRPPGRSAERFMQTSANLDPPSAHPPCLDATKGFQVAMQRAPVGVGAGITGAFQLCPRIEVVFSYHYGRLRYLHSGLLLDQSASVDLEVHANARWQGRQDLAAIRFNPLVVQIGAVPVVLRPVVTVFLAEEGSLKSKLTAGALEQTWGKVLIDYRARKWNASFSRSTPTIDFARPEIGIGTSAKGALGADVELEIYGIIGPFFEPAGFVKADYSTQSSCSLQAGLEGAAGIDLKVLGHVVGRKKFRNIFFYASPSRPCP